MRSSQYMILLGGSVGVHAVAHGLGIRVASLSTGALSEVNCHTVMGPNSTPDVKTITLSQVKTVNINDTTSTIVPTVSVTLAPVTETEFATDFLTKTVTADTVTETLTSTTIVTDTAINSITNTITDLHSAFETITVSTVTSTIPTPDGFVPISDTLNGFPRKRGKRDNHSPLCRMPTSQPPSSSPSSSSYPQSVVCKRTTTILQTATVTDAASTTTITPDPVTETQTKTIIDTSTEVPHTQTTVIIYLTDTITATNTQTQTQTATTTITEEATATVLFPGVCAPDSPNYLGPGFDGSTIYNVFNMGLGEPSIFFDIVHVNDAIECCTRCYFTSGCTGSAFDVRSSSCFRLHNEDLTCFNQSDNSALFVYRADGLLSLIVSNSVCGYISNGGPD